MIDELIKAIGSPSVLVGDALKDRYVHIWSMSDSLSAKAVIIPKNTEELSAILKICHRYSQKVVVHGGKTNLVGSTECKESEMVISLEKLNQIEEIDVNSRTMTVQSGVILEHIQNHAKEHDLLFPLNFGAKGSAQIGGVISTNAGGLRVIRFGMTRQLVLGLEVVLADGTIINSMKKIIKDNSGYDLKQLFIGAEGTLGVITKATLKLVEAPKSRNSAFIAFNEYEKVMAFMKFMDRGLAGLMSGFELIWGPTYNTMTSPPSSSKPPLDQHYKYYVLIESLGSDQNKDKEQMQSLLESALENEMILDAVMANSVSDLNWFWTIREDVHVIKTSCDYDHHFDVSLPIPLIGNYVDDICQKVVQIDGVNACYPFGHIADGNIHFIIDRINEDPVLIQEINKLVYRPLKEIGGSVSAEHGIGVHKKAYLPISRSPEEITLMKLLKKSLDPKGILNSGKIIDLD